MRKPSFSLDGVDVYKDMDVNILRKKVGMVFQKPNPFPMSIYDNIAYGPRIHGIKSKVQLDEIVERSLKQAAIWDECKDRLKKSALGMSGGQQQRLCIARDLAVEPDILLMDEPTSALDPISTSKIEDLAEELKEKYTIIMVTHNMQQAARIADKTPLVPLCAKNIELTICEPKISHMHTKEDMLSNFTAFLNAIKPFAPWARRRICEITPSQRRVLYRSAKIKQDLFVLSSILFSTDLNHTTFL